MWLELCESKTSSAAELAWFYAGKGEAGFRHLLGGSFSEIDEWQRNWSLAQKALYRLSLIAKHEDFPARKSASHCGGIKPYPPYLYHMPEAEGVADPGNWAYDAVMARLLKECGEWQHCDYASESNKEMAARLRELKVNLCEEEAADIIAAALAAADYAWKEEQKLPWTWQTLQGGACANGEHPPFASILFFVVNL